MIGWKELKLGKIAKVISGYAFKSTDFLKENGIPVIKIKNIKNGDIDLNECDYVSLNFLSLNEKYHLKRNDILVSLTGSHITQPNSVVGRIALYRNNLTSLLNQRAGKILPDTNLVDRLFLYAYLSQSSVREAIASKARGAANQANISPGDVEDTDILLPPLTTQHRIALILSAYDNLIENNLRRIKLLEELAQRTYEEWFVKFRVKGALLEMNSETGLPEEWKTIPIGTFIKFQKGKKVNLISAVYKESWEKLLLLDGIESGKYPYTDPNGQIIAERGDLIMLMDGARSSKVFFADKGVVGSTISKIVITNKKISSTLLKHFFESNFEWMQINNTGAAIPHANKNFIIKMHFKLPTNDFLDKWSLTIEPIYTQIQNLKDQNLLLKESRDILLPRLMSGKIEVEDLVEEELEIAADQEVLYKSR